MKVGQFLFRVGFRPSIELYTNGELIGWGYFPRRGRCAYHSGLKAYRIPLEMSLRNKALYNKRWSKGERIF
jgi:hypothetical protein